MNFRAFTGPVVGILTLLLTVGGSIAQPLAPQSLEENTNRKGDDIKSVQMVSGGFNNPPNDCAALCAKTDGCQAWTLVKNNSVCWIKRSIPPATPDACCTSGVIPRAIESNTDRPGSDITELVGGPVNKSGVEKCQAACQANSTCGAWTFVKPQVSSSKIVAYGKCYLKSPVPAARTDSCCVSGVMFRGIPQPPPK